MKFTELRERCAFWDSADRLGPDIPYTHWRLHFKSTMTELCRKKFRSFGQDAEFRPGAYAVGCSRISLGRRVVIRPGSMLHANPLVPDAGIFIEDDALVASGVHIYIDNHRVEQPNVPIIDQGDALPASVTLGKGCWLGANVIVLPGVTIGENSVVGAGSIVTRSIPARVVAAGNPARIIRNIE